MSMGEGEKVEMFYHRLYHPCTELPISPRSLSQTRTLKYLFNGLFAFGILSSHPYYFFLFICLKIKRNVL